MGPARRAKSLPSETGHILRHTYRTIAQRITLDKIEARLLLDHTVPGIDGIYIHEKALFDRLLAAQEKMSSDPGVIEARLDREWYHSLLAWAIISSGPEHSATGKPS